MKDEYLLRERYIPPVAPVKLDIDLVKFMSLDPWVGKCDARIPIRGIGVFPDPQPVADVGTDGIEEKGVILVGTDGHTMAIYRDADGVLELPETFGENHLILKPLPFWRKPACARVPRLRKRLLSVSEERLKGEVDVEVPDTTPVVGYYPRVSYGRGDRKPNNHWSGKYEQTYFAPREDVEIRGTFPDWRKVLPKGQLEFSGIPVDPAYLARVSKRPKSWWWNKFQSMRVLQSQDPGEDSTAIVVVHGEPDFLALIMGLRGNESWTTAQANFKEWLPILKFPGDERD